jgi:hypothetical protein
VSVSKTDTDADAGPIADMEPPAPRSPVIDDRHALRSLPDKPGIYAAWLTDAASLAQVGLAPVERRLIYVGKAGGRYGLRQRLRRHARSPWYSLLHALAAGRHVLPCWWTHARKNGPHSRVVHPSGLAAVATAEALAWQHAHLSWGYVTVPADKLRACESQLIHRHRPLINLAGRDYGSRSPLIRDDGFAERLRAWWLYRAAWLAVLVGQPDGYARRRRGIRASSIEVGWDPAGWPARLEVATNYATVELQREAHHQKQLVTACPPHLREALRAWSDSDEASTWVYAHTGLALTHGADITDVLTDAMTKRGRYPGPRALPDRDSLHGLHDLVSGRGQLIPDVVH